MHKSSRLIFLLIICFSMISGYLLSSISLVGRVGIGLFYHEYKFLKVWWKGGVLVFIVWLLVWWLQVFLKKKIKDSTMRLLHSIFLIIAMAGLFFSYNDFRTTIAHRWLGERFHLGVYLFWIGWIMITVYTWLQNTRGALNDKSKSENNN